MDFTTVSNKDRKHKEQQALLKDYLICAALIVPTFFLVIPYAATTWNEPLLPAMGLLPMGLGTVFALYRAWMIWDKPKHENRILLPESSVDIPPACSKVVEVIMNTAFALGIFGVLLASWIVSAGRSDRMGWLGAYSTVPMIGAMAIHSKIAWKALPRCDWEHVSVAGDSACTLCHGPTEPAQTSSPKMSGAVA